MIAMQRSWRVRRRRLSRSHRGLTWGEEGGFYLNFEDVFEQSISGGKEVPNNLNHIEG